MILPPSPRIALAWLLFGLLLWPAVTWPHATQLSASRIVLAGRDARVTLEMNGRDVAAALRQPALVERGIDAGVLPALRGALDDYVRRRVELAIGTVACHAESGVPVLRGDHVLLDLAWRCPPAQGDLAYRVTLFHEIDPAARHAVSVTGDVKRVGLLSAASPRLSLGAVAPGMLEVAGHYLLAGAEHIAIGYDHIAFLLAVIVWGRRFRPLFQVVTAFTAAHSVTLTLAALDVVRPPSSVVEFLIALSVVYVAVENFFVRDLAGRWRVTFLFGLVHGFGFAAVLREYGLPPETLVPALAAFNVGVELGQLAIVLASLGLFAVLDRAGGRSGGERDPRLVRIVSGGVILLGLFWMVQRLWA